MRKYLTASYEEKDIIKGLGAKYDAEKKQWYIPDNLLKEPFKKWLPEEKDNIINYVEYFRSIANYGMHKEQRSFNIKNFYPVKNSNKKEFFKTNGSGFKEIIDENKWFYNFFVRIKQTKPPHTKPSNNDIKDFIERTGLPQSLIKEKYDLSDLCDIYKQSFSIDKKDEKASYLLTKLKNLPLIAVKPLALAMEI